MWTYYVVVDVIICNHEEVKIEPKKKKKNCVRHSFSDVSIYIIITINYLRNKIGNVLKYYILKFLFKILNDRIYSSNLLNAYSIIIIPKIFKLEENLWFVQLTL